MTERHEAARDRMRARVLAERAARNRPLWARVAQVVALAALRDRTGGRRWCDAAPMVGAAAAPGALSGAFAARPLAWELRGASGVALLVLA